MKVKGEGNLAGALTKPLDGRHIKEYIHLSNQEVQSGRHDLIPSFEKAEDEEEVSGPNESAYVGQRDGVECMYTPWGYSSVGSSYSNCAHLLLLALIVSERPSPAMDQLMGKD